DVEGAELLEIRHAFQEEDALGQVAGVLHLANGFLVVLLGETVEAPVLAHLGVQEVLVDADELPSEHVVQRLDDLLAPLHAPSERARLAHVPGPGQEGRGSGLSGPGLSLGSAWGSGLGVLEATFELTFDAGEARSAVAARAIAEA